eukprot:Hpha_TRINITY_DN16873_c3_g1::TRINITY_DN16873_c3_g1_i1::g.149903::m.149903
MASFLLLVPLLLPVAAAQRAAELYMRSERSTEAETLSVEEGWLCGTGAFVGGAMRVRGGVHRMDHCLGTCQRTPGCVVAQYMRLESYCVLRTTIARPARHPRPGVSICVPPSRGPLPTWPPMSIPPPSTDVTASPTADVGVAAFGADPANRTQGCFWAGMAALFARVQGVDKVVPVHLSEAADDGTFGASDSSEAVLVRFDPGLIAFADLLSVWWRFMAVSVMPTSRGHSKQLPEWKSLCAQLRPRVFAMSEEQRGVTVAHFSFRVSAMRATVERHQHFLKVPPEKQARCPIRFDAHSP